MTESIVSCELKCPGYESRVSFPLGSDAKEGFIAWFEMQLAYLARWEPGATADLRETRPLKKGSET